MDKRDVRFIILVSILTVAGIVAIGILRDMMGMMGIGISFILWTATLLTWTYIEWRKDNFL